MPLTLKQGHELELARSAANDAMRAVAMQRERIRRESEDDDAFFAAAGFRQEVDVYFMLLALRWLREAVRLVAELTGDPALVEAIAGFDNRLPDARDMRNVREHVKEYIEGKGTLQKATTAADRLVRGATLGSRTWLGKDELSHFVWAGKELRLGDAVPAAADLYQALRDALAPYLIRGDDGQDVGIRIAK